MKFAPILSLLALLALCLSASPASAHRLNVFAWLDNDQVIVECNFGKDHPAKNADVTIIDEVTHRALLTGKTDASGHYVFTVPQVVREGHGLVIDVNAGQGHHNEWTMDASELYAAASLTAGFDASAIEQKELDQQQDPRTSANQAQAQMNASQHASAINSPEPLDTTHLRSIVREEVEASLAPVRKHIAAQSADGPTFAEVIGGIGWLVGIVGIILYFKSRRKPV